MTNLHCEIHPERETVNIFKNDRLIGFVQNINGEPTIMLNSLFKGQLTLNELDIVLDNWNQIPTPA